MSSSSTSSSCLFDGRPLTPGKILDSNQISPSFQSSSAKETSSLTTTGPFDTPTRKTSGQCSQSRYFTKLPASYGVVEEVEEEIQSGESDYSPLRQRNPKLQNSQRRTYRYDQQFSLRDPTGTPRGRVCQKSPIIAELRTSAIVRDEYTLLTTISRHLSLRYDRPQSNIIVHVKHSASLILGGSFDSSYMLTITALPSLVQPVTNKRNASLIQSFLEKLLSVPPERGIVRFQAITEERIAIDGTTILGKVESLELNTSPLMRTRSAVADGLRKAKSTVQLPGTARNRSQPTTKRGGTIESDTAAGTGLGQRKSIWSFLRR